MATKHEAHMLTADQIHQILPKNQNNHALATALNAVLPKYEINTPVRIAAFLAQTGHESDHYTRLIENLNYSAEGLMRTWPQRFKTLEFARKYERNPSAIANLVYANRMGNGDERSGDGYNFRGRGALQLTGKGNYLLFSQSIGITLGEAVEYSKTWKGAVESACWFWQKNYLNKFCDQKDFIGLTKAINGGINGLSERNTLFEKAKIVLAG